MAAQTLYNTNIPIITGMHYSFIDGSPYNNVIFTNADNEGLHFSQNDAGSGIVWDIIVDPPNIPNVIFSNLTENGYTTEEFSEGEEGEVGGGSRSRSRRRTNKRTKSRNSKGKGKGKGGRKKRRTRRMRRRRTIKRR